MTYHTMEGPIDGDMVAVLANILNDQEDKHHTIFFTSDGGIGHSTYVMKAMLENFNAAPDQSVLMVFNGACLSNAFVLMLILDRSIVRCLKDRFVVMIHNSTMSIELSGLGAQSSNQKGRVKYLAEVHKSDVDDLKGFHLTDKEMNLVLNGEDVYFSGKRLKKLLKDNKIQSYE